MMRSRIALYVCACCTLALMYSIAYAYRPYVRYAPTRADHIASAVRERLREVAEQNDYYERPEAYDNVDWVKVNLEDAKIARRYWGATHNDDGSLMPPWRGARRMQEVKP